MDELAPILYDLMDWFMNLPEPIQKAIGYLAIIGIVAGKLLQSFSMLGLGIQSLGYTFKIFGKLRSIIAKHGGLIKTILFGLGKGFGWLKAKFVTILGGMKVAFTKFTAFLAANPIILIIMAIIAAVLILNEAWKRNWFGIRQHVGNFVRWFSGVYDKYIKPVLNFIGTGVIFLKNIIGFAISHAGLIWERIWLTMYVVAAKIWNAILSGVQWWVNATLKPIQWLYDGIKGVAGILGVEMPELKFEIDISHWMAATEDAENRLAEIDRQLSIDFSSTLRDTANEINNWSSTLDSFTYQIDDVGKAMIESGERIDAGLEKGSGFLPDFGELLSGVSEAAGGLKDKIFGASDAIEEAGETASSTGSTINNQFTPYIIDSADAAKDAADELSNYRQEIINLENSISKFSIPEEELMCIADEGKEAWGTFSNASRDSIEYARRYFGGFTSDTIFEWRSSVDSMNRSTGYFESFAKNGFNSIEYTAYLTTNDIKDNFSNMGKSITQEIDAIKVYAKARFDTIGTAWADTILAMVDWTSWAVNAINHALNSIKDEIHTYHYIHKIVTYEYMTPYGGMSIGFFQAGGIVMRPTLGVLGEREPEAVIPLRKLKGLAGFTINYNPTINITAEVTQEIDIDRMMSKVDDYIVGKLKSMVH